MFKYLTDGTGSSTGDVFTYFFWALLQVAPLPHRRNRLQHRRCLHLLLLGPSPGRIHGPTFAPPLGGDRLHIGDVFTYFFWVLLQVGFMVLHVQMPHRRNRLQHRRCLHLLLLGPSPGRLFGPSCSPPHGGDRIQHWEYWVLLQVGFLVLHVLHLMVGTGSSTGGAFTYFFWLLLQVGSMVLSCSPPHRGDRLQHWWCVHLQYFIWVLLQVGSMVLHVLHLMVGTGSSTGGVFTYFFWVLLQVGPLSHGGDRLQH
jgi:hypothetical protein